MKGDIWLRKDANDVLGKVNIGDGMMQWVEVGSVDMFSCRPLRDASRHHR